MIRKLTLAVGFGAGYVLGAKAGTQRYEEIVSKARELAGMPQVQQATATVQDTASTLAQTAKDTVNEKVEKVAGSKDQPDVVVDIATGPMAGASASVTAPETIH